MDKGKLMSKLLLILPRTLIFQYCLLVINIKYISCIGTLQVMELGTIEDAAQSLPKSVAEEDYTVI